MTSRHSKTPSKPVGTVTRTSTLGCFIQNAVFHFEITLLRRFYKKKKKKITPPNSSCLGLSIGFRMFAYCQHELAPVYVYDIYLFFVKNTAFFDKTIIKHET